MSDRLEALVTEITEAVLERLEADDRLDRLADRAADRLAERQLESGNSQDRSPYLTVPEAAELLRCRPQRVRDLLSQRRLSRFKEGGRTLIRRSEVEALVVEEVAARVPRVSSDSTMPLAMRLRET
jgi:excisionase family DNA binding protein